MTSLAETLTAAGAASPFWHDGLGFEAVPGEVVEAYAAARLVRAGVTARSLLAAHCGAAWAEGLPDQPDLVAWHIGRGWLARLGDLERKARGLPRLTTITEANGEEASHA